MSRSFRALRHACRLVTGLYLACHELVSDRRGPWRADLIVTWERDLRSAPADGDFAFLTAGRTTLVPTTDGRALAAHVRLAVFAEDGARYSLDDVRAVARHELGHALGLAHHAAPTSVMAPLVRVERLTDEDRATLRALYALPVGARCSLPK